MVTGRLGFILDGRTRRIRFHLGQSLIILFDDKLFRYILASWRLYLDNSHLLIGCSCTDLTGIDWQIKMSNSVVVSRLTTWMRVKETTLNVTTTTTATNPEAAAVCRDHLDWPQTIRLPCEGRARRTVEMGACRPASVDWEVRTTGARALAGDNQFACSLSLKRHSQILLANWIAFAGANARNACALFSLVGWTSRRNDHLNPGTSGGCRSWEHSGWRCEFCIRPNRND